MTVRLPVLPTCRAYFQKYLPVLISVRCLVNSKVPVLLLLLLFRFSRILPYSLSFQKTGLVITTAKRTSNPAFQFLINNNAHVLQCLHVCVGNWEGFTPVWGVPYGFLVCWSAQTTSQLDAYRSSTLYNTYSTVKMAATKWCNLGHVPMRCGRNGKIGCRGKALPLLQTVLIYSSGKSNVQAPRRRIFNLLG